MAFMYFHQERTELIRASPRLRLILVRYGPLESPQRSMKKGMMCSFEDFSPFTGHTFISVLFGPIGPSPGTNFFEEND